MLRPLHSLAGAIARRGAGAAALRVASFAAAVACAAILVPEPAAAQRQSGIQVGYDPNYVLVSKDVGAERWSISYDGYAAIGVVFRDDGTPPSFIWCDYEDESDDGETLFFNCYGAGSCDAGTCGEDAWTTIGENLPIPASFFTPPVEALARAAALRAGPPRKGKGK